MLRVLFFFKPDPVKKDKKRFAEGLALLQYHRYAEALGYFSLALSQAPRSTVALLARARCHLHTGEPLLALADCARATSIDDHLPDAYLMKGKALYRINNYAAAVVEFDKASWYDRDNSEPICWRGLCRHQLGDYRHATADLKLAKSMGDENAAFYLQQQSNIPTWS